MIQNSRSVLKEIVAQTISEQEHFYVDVTLYCCDHLKGNPFYELVQVQTVEA
jgi:hypothetical protein